MVSFFPFRAHLGWRHMLHDIGCIAWISVFDSLLGEGVSYGLARWGKIRIGCAVSYLVVCQRAKSGKAFKLYCTAHCPVGVWSFVGVYHGCTWPALLGFINGFAS
jgi:hypothetical protein